MIKKVLAVLLTLPVTLGQPTVAFAEPAFSPDGSQTLSSAFFVENYDQLAEVTTILTPTCSEDEKQKRIEKLHALTKHKEALYEKWEKAIVDAGGTEETFQKIIGKLATLVKDANIVDDRETYNVVILTKWTITLEDEIGKLKQQLNAQKALLTIEPVTKHEEIKAKIKKIKGELAANEERFKEHLTTLEGAKALVAGKQNDYLARLEALKKEVTAAKEKLAIENAAREILETRLVVVQAEIDAIRLQLKECGDE